MHWVLLTIIWGGSSASSQSAIEFNSMDACQKAQAIVVKELSSRYIKTFCIAKGEESD